MVILGHVENGSGMSVYKTRMSFFTCNKVGLEPKYPQYLTNSTSVGNADAGSVTIDVALQNLLLKKNRVLEKNSN